MRAFTFVISGFLLIMLMGTAQAQGKVFYPSKKMGGYQVQIVTLDAAQSWISIQVMDRSGRTFKPGSIPLHAEYATSNIPFTPLSLEVKGTEIVTYVPVPEGQDYILRLQLKSGNTTFNPRFFINRLASAGN